MRYISFTKQFSQSNNGVKSITDYLAWPGQKPLCSTQNAIDFLGCTVFIELFIDNLVHSKTDRPLFIHRALVQRHDDWACETHTWFKDSLNGKENSFKCNETLKSK